MLLVVVLAKLSSPPTLALLTVTAAPFHVKFAVPAHMSEFTNKIEVFGSVEVGHVPVVPTAGPISVDRYTCATVPAPLLRLATCGGFETPTGAVDES